MQQIRTDLLRLIYGLMMIVAFADSRAAAEIIEDHRGTPPGTRMLASSAEAAAEDPVVARARQALRDGGVRAEDYTLVSRETAEWSDTSLGCRKPGIAYAQVITRGQILRFEGLQGTLEVHVAGDTAVLCATPPTGTPKRARQSYRARNLDVIVVEARRDLGARLGIDIAQIRLLGMTPTEWPDSNLGCRDDPSAQKERVTGYRLQLSARGAIYVYHTDLQRAFPCPAIESE